MPNCGVLGIGGAEDSGYPPGYRDCLHKFENSRIKFENSEKKLGTCVRTPRLRFVTVKPVTW
jgi:hypothetical protein